MSEPKAWASSISEVVPGVFRWSVADERIDGHPSDAHAVVSGGHVTLIDPLPIASDKIRELGVVDAIVLTAGNHQRAAWRFRREFGVPVYAPSNALKLEERPNATYAAGESLPGQLIPFQTPGPVVSMHVLWRPLPKSVVFMADLLSHAGGGELQFVPAEYQDEPSRTRTSVRRVLDRLRPQVLCFNHGPPLLENVEAALERALSEDRELESLHT